jgi:hypothetical protein
VEVSHSGHARSYFCPVGNAAYRVWRAQRDSMIGRIFWCRITKISVAFANSNSYQSVRCAFNKMRAGGDRIVGAVQMNGRFFEEFLFWHSDESQPLVLGYTVAAGLTPALTHARIRFRSIDEFQDRISRTFRTNGDVGHQIPVRVPFPFSSAHKPLGDRSTISYVHSGLSIALYAVLGKDTFYFGERQAVKAPIGPVGSKTVLLPKTSSMLVGAVVRVVGPTLYAIGIGGALV